MPKQKDYNEDENEFYIDFLSVEDPIEIYELGLIEEPFNVHLN